MAENYVIDRFRANKTTPYPEHPFWQDGDVCSGLAFIGSTFADLPDLTQIRGSISNIWQGSTAGGTEFTVIAFLKPCHLPPKQFAASLPLKQIKAGTLSSYAQNRGAGIAQKQARINAVDIWWNGQARHFLVNTLTSISVAELWPRPHITLHPGLYFARASQGISVQPDETEQDEDARNTGKVTKKGREKISVTAADTIFDDDGKDVFADTDKAIARLQEMTKLGNIFGRLFGRNQVGKGGGKAKGAGGKGAGQSQEAQEKPPGFFEGMAGWVRWHTPLGSALAKQFGERMGLVEKLLKKGDIDSALKLALKLGGAGGKKKQPHRFPLRLPDMRSNLDFNFGGGGYSMPIMGGSAFDKLRHRYTELAKELEGKGDFRRAAYIRSQLLDNQHEAVLTLERGELYTDAAKLSLKTGQEPTLTIRLYYKAGQKDKALAYAVRTDCFDRLAEDSRTQDPEYHAYVIKAWTDRLLASGQPLRALEVTDELVKGSDKTMPDLQLIDLRRDWLGQALAIEKTTLTADDDLFRTDLLVRALLYAGWKSGDMSNTNISPENLDRFPYGQIPTDNAFEEALSQFQTIVAGTHPDADKVLLSLLVRFSKDAKKSRSDQADFWAGPARILLDKFARTLLAQSAHLLTISDMQALKNLVQMAPLPVLAVDLGKIKTLNKMADKQSNAAMVKAPTKMRTTQILKACLLTNGTMLVWYDNDRLELLSQNGQVLWAKQVSQIKGILPLGTSPHVMILQEYTDEFGDGATRLTRFETHRRRFFEIGALHLVAWHDVISDGQWLVQIDNQVGALDMVKLSLAAPKLEFLWMAETSNDLHIMAFLHNPRAPVWLTRNLTGIRFGVMQAWQLEDGAKLAPQLCLPFQPPHEESLKPHIDWQWTHYQHGIYHNLGLTKSTANIIQFTAQDYDTGKRAIALAKQRVAAGYSGTDTVQVCDFGRVQVNIVDKNVCIFTPNMTNTSRQHKDQFTVQFEGGPEIRILSRGTNFTQNMQSGLNDISHICLCADQFGRLLRVDLNTNRVDVF